MDDLELEARLRTRLHNRFDDATPSPDLATNVRQAMTTQPRRVGFALRMRPIRLGWAAVAAALVLVVGAIGIGKVLGPTGPGVVATPSPSTTGATDRIFVVLPPAGYVLSKPEASLAGDVLAARIQALGIGNFTSGGGYGIEFMLPTGGPSDASIRAVLSATGDVRIVPLPAADYGAGLRVATLGAPLPKDEPALFGWEGIQAITSLAFSNFDGSTTGAPLLGMTLKLPAAQAFAAFVGAHPGETYAVVVDGRVALLPIAQAAASDGSVNLSNGNPGGSEPTDAYLQTAAVLAGGMLPEAWRGATVPVLISRAQAETAALTGRPVTTVQDASLSVELPTEGAALQVVWNVEVVVPECSALESCALSPGPYLVKVDAVTGNVTHFGSLEP